jgi:hypothetical protein
MANASFLPEDYLEKRAQRRTNIVCVGLFAIVVAGVFGVGSLQFRQKLELQARQRAVNARFEEAAKRLEDLDQLQTQRAALVQKATDVRTLLERLPRTRVLSELVNNMPATLSLLSLDLSTKVTTKQVQVATALDKAKVDAKAKKSKTTREVKQVDVTLSVEGVAPTDVQVAQFMTAIGSIPFFSDVNLAYTEEMTVEDHTMRKFRIDMKVNQDIEIEKIEPTMVKRDLNRNPMDETVLIDAKGNLAVPAASGGKTTAVPVNN